MSRELEGKLAVIVVFALICGYIFAPIPDKPLKETIEQYFSLQKGIDLQGGAEVVYRAYNPDEGRAVDQATTEKIKEMIRKRIDRRGLKEPKLNVLNEDLIQIQLAGIDKKDWEGYKGIIERMGKLEIVEVAEKKIQEQFAKEPPSPSHPTYRAVPWAKVSEGKGNLIVLKELITTGEFVENATTDVGALPSGRGRQASFSVNFNLGGDGAKRFYEATSRLAEENRKLSENSPDLRKIAIILDGKVESAPFVRSAIERNGQITGSFSRQEAEDLVVVLTTGGLPFPIGRVLETTTPPTFEPGVPEFFSLVGPSLGQDAIWRGLWAVGISLTLVSVFMIVYYRAAGVVAVVTLGLNLLFLMTSLAGLGATLTLPGIAGIVLTVGMAVDANVLIFERIREELAKNKTTIQAFEHGYSNALSAIVDGNITTLVVAVVLYLIGVGPVKGFGVTLALGILTTLLTAVYCGKIILKLLVVRGGIKTFTMMRFLAEPSFSFIKYMRPVALGSAALVALAILFAAFRLGDAFGIDFRGGNLVAFKMDEAVPIDAVRKAITSFKGADGLPKYSDAEVQILAETQERKLSSIATLNTTSGIQFKVTTKVTPEVPSTDVLKNDLFAAFREAERTEGAKLRIQPEPFERMGPEALSESESRVMDRKAGGAVVVNVRREADYDFERIRESLVEALPADVTKNEAGRRYANVTEGETRGSFQGIRVILCREDAETDRGAVFSAVEDSIRSLSRKSGAPFRLSESPFISDFTMGPSAAGELRDSTFWAMVISWILMIAYIWFRFSSVRFGAAAVIALIHDAIVTLGVILLIGVLVPASLGLSFDVSLSMMAGLLTIVGYSVNDTIVTFDRIRENLKLMKRATLAEIINASVNQTLSRTIITAFTTWIAAAALYIMTMTSSAGVSALALPLLIGLIPGTYSSIYIAGGVVLWWYKGERPVFESS